MFPGTICRITRFPKTIFWGRVSPMDAWVAYRIRAVELIAKAKLETKPELAEEFENPARAYLILAEMAERNSQLALTYEAPSQKRMDAQLALARRRLLPSPEPCGRRLTSPPA